MDGGASRSSWEASNYRGAKGWRVVIAKERNLCPFKQTTKLDSIGKRAKHRPDTVFNNIGHAVDLDLLRESYQQLEVKKAVGIDGVTKTAYGERLEDNLQDLLARIRRKAYKPQASRLVEIPKEDGSTRPLAIACFEDKIVQHAVSQILTLERVKKIVRGWINYHAISDNQRRVSSFILLSKRAIFRWINRKGGNRKTNWTMFAAEKAGSLL